MQKGFTTARQKVPGLQLGRSLDPLDEQDGGPVATASGFYLDSRVDSPLNPLRTWAPLPSSTVPVSTVQKLGPGAATSGYGDNGAPLATVDAWRAYVPTPTTPTTTAPVTAPTIDPRWSDRWSGVVPSGPGAPVTPLPTPSAEVADAASAASTSDGTSTVALVGALALVVVLLLRG